MNNIIATPFSVSAPTSVPLLELEKAKQEIEQRSSLFWECLDRQKNGDEGFIYRLVARAEYDDSSPDTRTLMRNLGDAKLAEVWPDLELSAWDAIALLGPRVVEDDVSRREAMNRARTREQLGVLQQLGFNLEQEGGKTYLYLPDREALLAGWQKLQSQRPELPELTIQSADNTAEHLVFVATYLKSSMLLSSGNKFVHDHLFHIIPILVFMLSSPAIYKETKALIAQVLEPTYQMLVGGKDVPVNWIRNSLPRIEATLGAWTDIFASLNNAKDVQSITNLFNKDFFRNWENLKWRNYFSREFGPYNEAHVMTLRIAHEWLVCERSKSVSPN